MPPYRMRVDGLSLARSFVLGNVLGNVSENEDAERISKEKPEAALDGIAAARGSPPRRVLDNRKLSDTVWATDGPLRGGILE